MPVSLGIPKVYCPLSTLVPPSAYGVEDPPVALAMTLGHAYFQPVVAMFGIIGNILLLFTIYYGRLKESPYVYLTSIAIGNLVICSSYQNLIWSCCPTCKYTFNTWYNLAVYERTIFYVVSNLFISWLTHLTTVMTIERYVYVRWPLKTQNICTRERARKICIVLFLLSCSSQLTRIWDFEVSIQLTNNPVFQSGIKNFTCDLQKRDIGSSYFCSWDPHLANDSSTMDWSCQIRNISNTHLRGANQTEKYVFIDSNEDGIHERHSPTGDSSISYENEEFKDTSNISDQIFGSSFKMDSKCIMLLSRSGDALEENYQKFYQHAFDTVTCIAIERRERVTWYENARKLYLNIWDKFNIFCTVILTVFNILIIRVVRRANKNASLKLSSGDEKTALRRSGDENRLTWSLFALSTMKIISGVVYASGTYGASFLYGEEYSRSHGFQIHLIVSNAVTVTEYALNFYLLAFINRKFKTEFIKQVKTLRILKLAVVRNIWKKVTGLSRKDTPSKDQSQDSTSLKMSPQDSASAKVDSDDQCKLSG